MIEMHKYMLEKTIKYIRFSAPPAKKLAERDFFRLLNYPCNLQGYTTV
jgi:hypothetical protein